MSEAENETPTEPETPDETSEPEAPAEPAEPTPEEEEAEEAEQQPEPEQPQALSEKEIEAKQKKLDRATDFYVKKLQGILEDEFDRLIPSPLTLPNVLGFIYSPQEAEIPLEQVAATQFVLGLTPAADLKDAPDASRCTDCAGWGKVLTGSLVPEFREAVCRRCNGAGAVGERYSQPPPISVVPEPVNVNGEGQAHAVPSDQDPWGRKPGDPDYGRLPNYVQT